VITASTAPDKEVAMRTILYLVGLIILAVFVLGPVPGAAAPQILGLVAAAEPTTLKCKNGNCSAEFSSFCLQASRMAPGLDHKYVISGDQGAALLVTLADGTTRTVAARKLVSVKSIRGFSSVRISIPEPRIEALSLGQTVRRIALKISPLASLVPVPETGDTEPIGRAERRLFTGPLRSVAEGVASQPNRALDIVQTTNRLLNGLTGDGFADAIEPEKFWRRTMGKVAMDDERIGVRNAAREFKICAQMSRLFSQSAGKATGIRTCLETVHDEYISDITMTVWKALKLGM
jgi:hypothetical protein